MRKILTSIFALLISGSVWANVNEDLTLGKADAIDLFDGLFYKPHDIGLRDMTCEVRILGLTEKIKERIAKNKLSDVSFKLYWVFPGKAMVEVVGLPEGFQELKVELSAVILGKLDILFPKKLSDEFRSYKFTSTKDGKDAIVKGVDSTNMNDVSEVTLIFGDSGKLNSLRAVGPTGVKTVSFSMSKKEWSENKIVIDDMDVRINAGIHTTSIKQTLEYKKVSAYGLPVRLVQDVTQRINSPEKFKSNSNETSDKSTMVFSNHTVNDGSAFKYIQRMSEGNSKKFDK